MKKSFKIILFSVAGLIVFMFLLKATGALGKEEGLKVAAEIVTRRTITELITANGKIQPQTEVKISSDVSGEIVELFVKEGDEVQQGQLLLKIKPDIYLSNSDRVEAGVNSAKANLANAKARLAQVKANFEQAKLNFNRSKDLFDQKAISKADFEQVQTAFLGAEAEVTATEQTVAASGFSVLSAEASLKEARENLNKTSIYAPMSGTVSKLNVEKGERVVGTIQMSGTELLRIADLSVMEVIVDVNENDIVKVKRGDTALIEIDAYFDKEFRGVVSEIANSSNNTGTQIMSAETVTDFEVRILILKDSYTSLIPSENPKFIPFRPGMSATVDIRTKTEKNILTVPIQAVTTRVDTGDIRNKIKNEQDSLINNELIQDKEPIELVFVLENGIAKVKPVKTGIQDNEYIRIIEGLDGTERVIIAPYSLISKRLNNGQKISETDITQLFTSEEK